MMEHLLDLVVEIRFQTVEIFCGTWNGHDQFDHSININLLEDDPIRYKDDISFKIHDMTLISFIRACVN